MKPPPSADNNEDSSRYRNAPYYEIARHSHNYSDEVVRFYSDSGAVVATKTVNSSDAEKKKRARRVPPSRQKSKQRRAAFRMYELIKCIPEQARTERQKSSFEWALSVVGDLIKTEKRTEESIKQCADASKCPPIEHHAAGKSDNQKSSDDWVEKLVDGLFKTPANNKSKGQQLEQNQQRSSVDWDRVIGELQNSSNSILKRKSFQEDQLSNSDSASKTESETFIANNGHSGSIHSYAEWRSTNTHDSNAIAFSSSFNEAALNGNAQNDTKSIHNDIISATQPNDHVLVIIDRNQPDGVITPEKWNKVQVKLASIFLSVLDDHPGAAPRCSDCGWYQQRYKMIACTDQRSMELYKIAISRVGEVWPGAKVRVISRNQIPSVPRVHCRMPAEPSDPQTILEIIRVSNPQLPTSTWKITKLEPRIGDYRSVTLAINAESMEPLARTDGIVNYGFTGITMKVYKSDEMFFKKRTAQGM